MTRDWWTTKRQSYSLRISQTVIDEVEAGDPAAATLRMDYLLGIPLLDLTEQTNEVALSILGSGLLPQKAARDAVHIAVSCVHGVDFLLTWNCRHIANAAIMRELSLVVADCGYEMPILCTPDELLGA